MLYREQSRYEEAEPLYQRALAIRKKTSGSDYLATLDIQCDGMKGVRFFFLFPFFIFFSFGLYLHGDFTIFSDLTIYGALRILFFLLPGTE